MSSYIKLFDNHTLYLTFAASNEFITPNVSACIAENEAHFNPYVDPCASEKIKTTYDYVEIGGIKWATKNVGALTETDYGQKFSWGGIEGYTNDQVGSSCHAFSWADYELGDGSSAASNMAKYNSTDGKTVLEAEDDAATVNMGSGWRMPTTAEFQALGNAVNTVWTQVNNVYGLLCTDKTDSSKTLFFPAAGVCVDGSVSNVGSYGYYWSSSLYSNNTYAHNVYFNSSSVYWQNSHYRRCTGRAVRGVVG